jgi:Sec1 family
LLSLERVDRRESAASLNDMKDMLATLPQFQEQRDQFSLHLTLAEKCMDIFAQKKLLDIGLIEQVCSQITPLTLELCYWSDTRWQNSQNSFRGYGPYPLSSRINVPSPYSN